MLVQGLHHARQPGDAEDGHRAGDVRGSVEHEVDVAAAQRRQLLVRLQQLAGIEKVDLDRLGCILFQVGRQIVRSHQMKT